ncbi:MAG: hypothetical protein E7Z84_07085 [Methanosphaera stadtmanae]|nr:hypothetical protein [Methanosphaera stadtmanae]
MVNKDNKLEKLIQEKEKLYNRNIALTESKQVLMDKINEKDKLINKLTDLNDKYLEENLDLSKTNKHLEDSNKLLYNKTEDMIERNHTLIKTNKELLDENKEINDMIEVQNVMIDDLKVNYLEMEEKLKQLLASEGDINISYYKEINNLFINTMNQQYNHLEAASGYSNSGFSSQERNNLIKENEHLKNELNKMSNSNSWKLTEPLRSVGRKLRKK